MWRRCRTTESKHARDGPSHATEFPKRDLRRAGIEFVDAKGRRADLHSLRHTPGTNLALAGTAPRVAMEVMRHSGIRLTTKTYVDTGFLPLSDAVAKLPSFLGSPEKGLTNFVPAGSSLVHPCHQLDKW